jgi:hypothetical protein
VASIADYPTGDACLFCHRDDIGASWLDNAHAWTIRPVGEAPAVRKVPPGATHLIGRERYRALKQIGYGKFSLLSVGGQTWQDGVFEKQCVGCHTTAVNPQSGEFSSIALDCYACHGNVPENHAARKGTALLSKASRGSKLQVVSICGSCHLRGGRSQTSGRPYPYAYVAGDDLFKDFKVNLNLDRETQLDANDTHVYVKTRALFEREADKTCVDCHRVHGPPERQDADRKLFSEICHY